MRSCLPAQAKVVGAWPMMHADCHAALAFGVLEGVLQWLAHPYIYRTLLNAPLYQAQPLKAATKHANADAYQTITKLVTAVHNTVQVGRHDCITRVGRHPLSHIVLRTCARLCAALSVASGTACLTF